MAKRLALIQADIWTAKDMAGDIYELDRVPELITRNQTEATHKMLQDITSMGHTLVKTDKGHYCSRCRVRRARTNFNFWGSNPCLARPLAREILDKRRRLQSTGSHTNLHTPSHTTHTQVPSQASSSVALVQAVPSDDSDDFFEDDVEDNGADDWLAGELENVLVEGNYEQFLVNSVVGNLAEQGVAQPSQTHSEHNNSNTHTSKRKATAQDTTHTSSSSQVASKSLRTTHTYRQQTQPSSATNSLGNQEDTRM